MGKLIVIEGLDGSGKGTQAALLVKNLEAQGLAVRKVSFPDYASDSSALVKMYLSGQFGSDPSDVNAYAASTFYAVDRFASFKRDWERSTGRAASWLPTATPPLTPSTSAASCPGSSGTAI